MKTRMLRYAMHFARRGGNSRTTSGWQNDLGLDSLARVELLHRVEEAFQVRLLKDTFASAATVDTQGGRNG
jgi:acyl carrier protein